MSLITINNASSIKRIKAPDITYFVRDGAFDNYFYSGNGFVQYLNNMNALSTSYWTITLTGTSSFYIAYGTSGGSFYETSLIPPSTNKHVASLTTNNTSSSCAISQTLGLPFSTYRLTFSSNQRNNSRGGNGYLSCVFGTTTIFSNLSGGNNYAWTSYTYQFSISLSQSYIEAPITFTKTNISGYNAEDSINITNITLKKSYVLNGNFLVPLLTVSNTFVTLTTAQLLQLSAYWTITNVGAGVYYGTGSNPFYNVNSPHSTQAVIIQGNLGSSVTFTQVASSTLSAGTYTISLNHFPRGDGFGGRAIITIYWGGVQRGIITNPAFVNSWVNYTTTFTLTSSQTGSLSIVITRSSVGDDSISISDIVLL